MPEGSDFFSKFPFSELKGKESCKISVKGFGHWCGRLMKVEGRIVWFELDCPYRKSTGYRENRCDFAEEPLLRGLFLCKNKDCPSAKKFNWTDLLIFQNLKESLLQKGSELIHMYWR